MATTAVAASVALRCGLGKAFVCGEYGMVGGGDDGVLEGRGRPQRLRWSGLEAGKRRWAVRNVLAAPASPAQRNVGNIASSSSLLLDSFARRISIGTDHPRRDERRKDEGRVRHTRDRGTTGREPVSPEKLDEWMRDSVVEIVRKIGDAPLLVHVFSNSRDGPAGLRLETEAADAESWPHIKRQWSTGAALPPDGVILVEEIKDEGEIDVEEEDAACSRSSAAAAAGDSSKTWGVVVQGRGADCAACYILNTCRVRSSFGFCTHFCLARAKCFGDTAEAQLKNAWLLGRKHHRQ